MKLVLQVIICIVLIMIKQTVSKMVYGLLMKVPCLMLMMVIHHHYEEGEQDEEKKGVLVWEVLSEFFLFTATLFN